MKKLYQSQITYAAVAVVIALFISFSYTVSGAAVKVHAATTAYYEQSNVIDDLKNSVIGDKLFKVEDYPADKDGEVQVLAFFEYGYSFHEDKQESYGLYVYIYNPQQSLFNNTDDRNKLQMRVGGRTDESYAKYNLQYLNCSMDSAETVGLFLKYKVALTDAQREELLGKLDKSERKYDVSGIELLTPGKDNADEYPIARDDNGNVIGITYTFKGYAEGFGEDANSKTTLICSGEHLTVISPEVHHTTYRPTGTKGYNDYRKLSVRDSLSSVYFAIPKNLCNYYNDLLSVHASWLEAETAPVFITGNKEVYDGIRKYIGDWVGVNSTQCYPQCDLKYGFMSTGNIYTQLDWGEIAKATYGVNRSDISYHVNGFTQEDIEKNPANNSVQLISEKTASESEIYNKTYCLYSDYCLRSLSQLNYIFYADNVNASRYGVSSQEIYDWVYKTYPSLTNGHGHNYPADDSNDHFTDPDYIPPWPSQLERSFERKYGIYAPLFDYIAEDFTELRISADEEYSITSQEWTTKNWWWFASWLESTNLSSQNVKAIYEVTDEDFSSGTMATICDKLFVAEKDYNEFKTFYDSNKTDNRIYLFRFDKSEYISTKVNEYKFSPHYDDAWGGVVDGEYISNLGNVNPHTEYLDDNAYICKEKFYIDFDIIDVEVIKGGVAYVIAAVMSPITIIPGTDPPVDPVPAEEPKFWKYSIVICSALAAGLVVTVIVRRMIRRTK